MFGCVVVMSEPELWVYSDMSLSDQEDLPAVQASSPPPTQPPPPPTGTNGSRCPTCHLRVENVRKHCLQQHLPWYVSPQTACWECETQCVTLNLLYLHVSHTGHVSGGFTLDRMGQWAALVGGFLELVARLFMVTSVDNLLASAVTNGYFPAPEGVRWDLMEELLAQEFENLTANMVFSSRSISPPSTVMSLMYWRTLAVLAGQLNPQDQATFRASAGVVTLARESSAREPSLVDTHSHVDLLLERWECTSWEELEGVCANGLRISAVITSSCFPDRWGIDVQALRSTTTPVLQTVGLHPRLAPVMTAAQWTEFRARAAAASCIAVGEIGLDYTSGSAADHWQQRDIFRRLLLVVARVGKPVVIHCRGSGASRDCRAIMKGSLTRFQSVHVHGFVGSVDEVGEWKAAFSSVIFGLSTLCLRVISS